MFYSIKDKSNAGRKAMKQMQSENKRSNPISQKLSAALQKKSTNLLISVRKYDSCGKYVTFDLSNNVAVGHLRKFF